jgi:hypothetical protein
MALTKCEECGQTISTQAYTCPHCGAPLHAAPPQIPPTVIVQQAPEKKKGMGFVGGCLLVIFIFIIIGVIGGIVGQTGRTGGKAEPQASSAPSSAPAYPSQEDVALQPVRKKLMEEGFKNGILMKMDGIPGLGAVQVGPGYYLLTFDEKKTLIETLWKYEFVRTSEEYSTLNVFDGYSGKKVGSCWKRGFEPK